MGKLRRGFGGGESTTSRVRTLKLISLRKLSVVEVISESPSSREFIEAIRDYCDAIEAAHTGVTPHPS